MTRLLVQVEGETEEAFVNAVLAPHLYSRGFRRVDARLIGRPRSRQRRGGIIGWPSARFDLLEHLKGDSGRFVTTLVDYYALPTGETDGWPGRAEAATKRFGERAETVHRAVIGNIQLGMDRNFNASRLIPYVVMHEFEGLLFSDCDRFATGIGRPELAPLFQEIADQFATPEEINDSKLTAPSKRVQSLIPGYQKVLLGTQAALSMGLPTIRARCAGFDTWLKRLEQIPSL
ncbi:MAG: DUF4276 family protein [Vicinamibacteria bacterium]